MNRIFSKYNLFWLMAGVCLAVCCSCNITSGFQHPRAELAIGTNSADLNILAANLQSNGVDVVRAVKNGETAAILVDPACFFQARNLAVELMQNCGLSVSFFDRPGIRGYISYRNGEFYEAVTLPPIPPPGSRCVDDFILGKNEDGFVVLSYTGKEATVVIPQTVDGRPVNSIGERAFEMNTNIISVTIPFGVTNISSQAFTMCSNLTSCRLPNGLRKIDTAAFQHCWNLSDIIIPSSVSVVGRYAFVSCALRNVKIPKSVTEICDGAFYGCEELTNVQFSVSVTNIEYEAFAGCQLTDVALPDRLVRLSADAFSSCPMTKLTVPASVTQFSIIFNDSNISAVNFLGNAPSNMPIAYFKGEVFDTVSPSCTNLIFYHLPDAKGWGARFRGRPTAIWRPEGARVTEETNQQEWH